MPFGPVLFDTPNLTFEAVICEIIDNSIAAGADRIHVEIGNDTSVNGRETLNFSVYDDGQKIPETPWAEENIAKAFEIEYDPNNPPPRTPGEVGKFHVGMKLATLSKFDTVSMVTISADDLVLHRHGTYPSNKRRLADLENEYGGANNPSSTPPKAIDIDEIVETLKSKKMTTFVGGRTPRVQLLFGGKGDRGYKNSYLQHLRIFLGITYQIYLEENDFKLTLGLWDQPVKPIDPFWENFSTENLRDFANGLVDADKKKTVINLARFGTLYQPLDEVKIDGKTLKVQGFITPHGKTSKVALAQYFPKLKVNDGDTIAFDGAVPACGSTTLKSSNTGGFYFYRGKRCINFGGDAYNNHGWYDLKDPIASAWATRLRIRVQYEDDLDDKLELHPNKNRFNDIADIVWQRIKTRLQPRIGGEAFRAAPYDEARQFCLWPGEGDSQFSVMNSSIWDYKLCSDCTLLIHDKNEYCGTETCDTCGEDPTINTCLRDTCRTACTHCSEVGEHKSDECPTLFCDECEFHHPPEEEHYCPDCKFQECECPEEGEGEEEGEDDEGDDDEGDEDDEALLGHYEFDDGFAYAELPKDARQWCIDTLKQILSDLEIDIAELE